MIILDYHLIKKQHQPFIPYQFIFKKNKLKNMSNSIIHLTDDQFEEKVLQSTIPVLVDYWAEWCGPCKMIAPVLESLATEYEGKLKIAKLNIDENPKTPIKYHVKGIPTLTIFKDGSIQDTKVGALSKSQLIAFIDSTI